MGSNPAAWGFSSLPFLTSLTFRQNNRRVSKTMSLIDVHLFENDVKVKKIPSWAARDQTDVISSDWFKI